MNRCFSFGMAAAVLLFSSVSVEAGFCGKNRQRCKSSSSAVAAAYDCEVSVGCGYGSGCGPSISYEYVTETKLVDVVKYVQVEHEREVTIRKPEWVEEPRMVKSLQRVEKVENVTVKKPVWTDSIVQKTKVVCRRVPVTEVKTVTVNTGHWGYESVAVGCGVSCDPCNSCDPCGSSIRTVCRKVWIPSCEEREISCVRYETVREEVPYDVKVRTCSYEEEVVPVTKVTYEPTEKQVVVKVMKYTEHKVMQKYHVCERQVVQEEVQVCRRVPIIVTDACSAGSYSSCGGVVVDSNCCH